MSVLFSNNALSTLAGSIANTDTSATLAPGTGALFPNPTGGNYFMLTFVNASNTLWEIVKVTARTGDVVTIVRAQEGTAAQAWPAGSNANALITAGALTQFTQFDEVRTRLTANTTFYVSTSGSDVTGDGSSGNPWATAQHAVNVLQDGYDLCGFTATINRANGAYTDGVVVKGPLVGQAGAAGLVFTGSAAGSVSVTTNLSYVYEALYGAAFQVTNQTMSTTLSVGGNILATGSFGIIEFGSVNFGACSLAHINAATGTISAINNYTISGNAAFHYDAASGGFITANGIVVTITGNPTITTFASAQQNGSVNSTGSTFSGSVTATRYSATIGGSIFTQGGGANYFPGTIAGSTGTAPNLGYYN